MRFSKLHGIGNDFIVTHYVDAAAVDRLLAQVPGLCDRRTGIGADGVILVLPSADADYRMRIFNADGSEAEMCGNGMRCLVVYLQQAGLARAEKLTIETAAGMITTHRLDNAVCVDMGSPVLDAARIPTSQQGGRVVMQPLRVAGREFEVTAVSMGNPHAVVFVSQLSDELVAHYGRELEHHDFFPRRVNAEFVRVISPREIEMRVFERGCGETRACGTGACASVVAGVLTGALDTRVTVHLLGGDLVVEWDGDEGHGVSLIGPAQWVFDGDVAVDGID